MKEFNFLIDKAFVSGQRTETIGARNRDLLVTTKNMRPTEYGLAAIKTINESMVSPPATSWPYPQIFKGRGQTVLADEDRIYFVDESNWAVTLQKVYRVATANNPTDGVVANPTFTGGASWTMGTNWSIAGGKLVASAVTAGNTASQLTGDLSAAIVAGRLYRVTYTIETLTSGSVWVAIGGTDGTVRTEAGTYSEDLIATSTLGVVFQCPAGVTGTIDNVTCNRITDDLIPTGGGAWHFADFGGVWFLFKENCIVAQLPYYSGNRLVMITSADDDLTCNTGENMGNRLFLGGITAETLLATDNFTEAWNAWVENSSDWSDEMTYADMTLGTNTVMYSTRVGGDVYWPFIFEMALLGLPYRVSATVVADLKANYIDWIRKGEIGFVPLQHQGSIQCLKRLGNTVVAYCTDGVSIISARDGRGFRAKPVHHAGIASRSAVSGDDSKHLFLDSNNVLWAITPDGAINRVIGKGTFDSMVAAEAASPIVGTYDPEEQEHYICSGTQGFIYTRTGLGKITTMPTSLIVTSDGLEGVLEDLATPDIEVETETFDMGMRALKTIHSIAIGFQDITDMQVVVKYRYDDSTTWRTSPAFDVNGDSIAVPLFTAKDFRLVFTGTPGAEAKIDYVDVAYQVSDKRNIRRAYE